MVHALPMSIPISVTFGATLIHGNNPRNDWKRLRDLETTVLRDSENPCLSRKWGKTTTIWIWAILINLSAGNYFARLWTQDRNRFYPLREGKTPDVKRWTVPLDEPNRGPRRWAKKPPVGHINVQIGDFRFFIVFAFIAHTQFQRRHKTLGGRARSRSRNERLAAYLEEDAKKKKIWRARNRPFCCRNTCINYERHSAWRVTLRIFGTRWRRGGGGGAHGRIRLIVQTRIVQSKEFNYQTIWLYRSVRIGESFSDHDWTVLKWKIGFANLSWPHPRLCYDFSLCRVLRRRNKVRGAKSIPA